MNGLVCDNPKCDWEDTSIEFEDFEKYLRDNLLNGINIEFKENDKEA